MAKEPVSLLEGRSLAVPTSRRTSMSCSAQAGLGGTPAKREERVAYKVSVHSTPGSRRPFVVSALKNFLKRTLPGPYAAARAARKRCTLYLLERRLRPVERAVIASRGLTVQGGPFRGMAYLQRSVGSAFLPKVLGSYEAELHPVLEQVLRKEYDHVINVGCGEGYYAVGLALRLPRAAVYAFDTDPLARQLCRGLGQLNNVAERLVVEETCSPARLRALTCGRSLLLCDCEGYELDLLRPEDITDLRQFDGIVELHDSIDPNISSTVRSRFTPTHELALLPQRQRDPSAYPSLHGLSPGAQRLALEEFRPQEILWGFMTPRNPASPQS